MNTATARLIGVREFELALDDWSADVREAFIDELEDLGKTLVRKIRARTPRGPEKGHEAIARRTAPGTLARQITWKRDQLRLVVRAGARHAHLVEYGHQGPAPAPPHPFFLPTVILERHGFNERCRRALRRPAPGIGPGVPEIHYTGGGLL